MTVTPIPGVAYYADPANQRWVAPGRSPLPFVPPVDPGTGEWPFNQDEPWRLEAGESFLDGIPSGVPVVNATDFTTSNDLRTIMQAIETTPGHPGCYVQLEARTYYINSLVNYGDTANPNWLGFANSSRRVMGLIGAPFAGGTFTTKIEASPTMVSSTTGARAFCLDPRQGNTSASWTPVPVSALYFSNSGTSVPLFFAGIDFRGTLQTPFGTYSTDAQTKFRRNLTVSSPLPYQGISLWRAVTGARVQHCRFSGFGYALNTAPPFEKGCMDTNYGNEIVRRIEIDGRIAADINSARPLASGGLMWNKGQSVRFEDSYMHHTRRSGFATNTNTNSQSELYVARRIRTSDVANPNDQYAGDNGGFNASNVEEVVGIFEYDDVYLNTEQSGQHHINLAIPRNVGSGGLTVLPNRPIIKVYGGFKSDDPIYGGCLRISVGDRPNSTGISPAWQKLTDLGIAGSNLFDITNADGDPMTGVRHSAYNASLHNPSTHFIVRY